MSERSSNKTHISAPMPRRNINLQPLQVSKHSTRSRSSVDLIHPRGDNSGLPYCQQISGNNDLRARIQTEHVKLIDELQNKKSELENALAHSLKEIRTLRTLVQRLERALSCYESEKANLPTLMRHHEEEIRCFVACNRKLSNRNRELERSIRQKDAMLVDLTEQNKFFCELNKSKELKDRYSLVSKISVLEEKITEQQNENRLLARRLQYETKQYKAQLANAQKKVKQTNVENEKLRREIESLNNMMPMKTKFVPKKFFDTEAKPDFMSSGTMSDSEVERILNEHVERKKRVGRVLSKPAGQNSKKQTEKSPMPLLTQRNSSNVSKTSTENSEGIVQQKATNTPANNSARIQVDNEDVEPTPLPVSDSTKLVNSHTFCDDPEKLLGDLLVNSDGVRDEMHKLYMQHSHDNDVECQENSCSKGSQTAKTLSVHEVFDFIKSDLEQRSHSESPLPIVKSSSVTKLPILDTQSSSEEKPLGGKALIKRKTQTKSRNVAYVEPVSHFKQSRPNSKTKVKSTDADVFNEREAFLDTFCRQANSMRETKPTKRNSVSETLYSKEFSESRKQKLLAKLKAIEETMTD